MTMTLTRVASLVFNTPLLATETAAVTLASALADRFGVVPMSESLGVAESAADARLAPGALDISASFVGIPDGPVDASGRMSIMWRLCGDVAIIPVMGELVNRGAWIGASSGLTSYEGLSASLRAARDAANVRAIILDCNSPGGAADNAIETGRLVREVAGVKRVVAVVNSMACSAAYAIAAGASEIVTAETGVTGSIGVMFLHLDRTKALKDMGVKPAVFRSSNAANKAEGGQIESLTDGSTGRIQARLDAIETVFFDFVADMRPSLSVESTRALKGETMMGAAAVAAGLADRVGTMETAIASLLDDDGDEPTDSVFSTGGPMSNITPEAHAAAIAAARGEGVVEGRAAIVTGFCASLATVFPGDARADTLADLLKAGTPAETAATVAARMPAPVALAAAAPVVAAVPAQPRLVPDPKIDAAAPVDADAALTAGLEAAVARMVASR